MERSIKNKEKLFKNLVFASVLLCPLLNLAIFITLGEGSLLVFEKESFNFFFKTDWDPIGESFGALVFLFGTFATSLVALLIAIPFSLSVALVTAELFKENPIAKFISFMIETISAIPSVVVGLWGIFFITPIIQVIQESFGLPPYGTGFLTASLILSFMIIPYAASLGREVIRLVPNDIKEGAYSLGASRFEVVKKIILPYVSSGFFGGILLSFGRAIGETIAVTMLIGNSNHFPDNILSPTNTMASIIANEFAEATDDLYISALMGIGLVLFISTIFTSILGKWVIQKLT